MKLPNILAMGSKISKDINTEITIKNDWRVFVFSEDKLFLDVYHNSFHDISIESNKLSSILVSDKIEFKKHLDSLDMHTIVHLDSSNKSQDWLLSHIKAIRESEKSKNVFITVWSNQEWDKIPIDLIQGNNINEIRSTNSFSVNKVKYIILSNLQNQKQIIELLELKSSLEQQVYDRTESLTNLNKKLQSAIIQNSNINTKLHQQKLQIETQNHEINERNSDLEKAFKKSSKQHIKLYKVLHENEQQRIELQNALKEIQQNNSKLTHKNEEISTQNDHIAQQREEIQSQRDMAIQQHDLISIQQNEIKENITYARRIQKAMLTPKKLMKQIIPNHFVLNKPKAIVSGDFFWVAQNKNHTVVAVADCTGHGISGAMMSMLGIAYLNEIVNKDNIINSATILEQLRERIILSLHQELSHDISFSRDGMDISICVIDILENTMEYSGANNPIYVFRKEELIELRPDKMPIGIHEFFEESFSSQKELMEEGDTIYMFSDGYADQFGGTKGKKLKYNRFKELLGTANEISIHEQKEFLNKEFELWRGEHEQIDDVIVLGYRFS